MDKRSGTLPARNRNDEQHYAHRPLLGPTFLRQTVQRAAIKVVAGGLRLIKERVNE